MYRKYKIKSKIAFNRQIARKIHSVLHGRTIADGSSTYPYRAYLEAFSSYGEEAKSTQLTSSQIYKDTVGKMDQPDPTKSSADVNLGLKKLTLFTSESKVEDMIKRLHGDTFNQGKYFLDQVKVRLRLHHSKNQFCLMCSETNPNLES